MTDEEFKNTVRATLDGLPDEFRTQLDNVEITIEESPRDKSVMKYLRSTHRLLLGLYQGVPKTKRFGTFQLPDKITLYKEPILCISGNDEEVRLNIRKTVLHELGHHFGLSDQRLSELGT